MKLTAGRHMLLITISFLLMLSISCSLGKFMKTETVSEVDISGFYTLFLYNDWMDKKIAILDIEGDGYTFVMSGSRYNYVSQKGVSAEDALKSAVGFIYSQRNQWKIIQDDNGNIIGYDLRPLYHTTRYGASDILDVAYRAENDKVIVSVYIKQSIQRLYYRDIFGTD